MGRVNILIQNGRFQILDNPIPLVSNVSNTHFFYCPEYVMSPATFTTILWGFQDKRGMGLIIVNNYK
jgi:hypothetical protein